jgi:hypothetical protein
LKANGRKRLSTVRNPLWRVSAMSELERELPDQWPDDEDLYYPPGIKLGPPELLMLATGVCHADEDPPSLKLRRAGDGAPQPPDALPMNEAAAPPSTAEVRPVGAERCATQATAEQDPPSLKLRRAGGDEELQPDAVGFCPEPAFAEATAGEPGTLNLERGTPLTATATSDDPPSLKLRRAGEDDEMQADAAGPCLEPETRNEEPGTALTATTDDDPPSLKLRRAGDEDDHDAVSPPARRLTARELAARKRNAQFAGVKTEEGKAVSRLNARKHGVFATALTPLDHRELHSIYDEFAQTAQPEGAIEEALVEKMALCWLRIQRCARAEAELHADVWLPTAKELHDQYAREGEPWRRAGQTGFFKPHTFEKLVSLVHRYDTSLTNQLMRLMHELERVQRRRTGEPVVPPVSADVNVSGL